MQPVSALKVGCQTELLVPGLGDTPWVLALVEKGQEGGREDFTFVEPERPYISYVFHRDSLSEGLYEPYRRRPVRILSAHKDLGADAVRRYREFRNLQMGVATSCPALDTIHRLARESRDDLERVVAMAYVPEFIENRHKAYAALHMMGVEPTDRNVLLLTTLLAGKTLTPGFKVIDIA